MDYKKKYLKYKKKYLSLKGGTRLSTFFNDGNLDGMKNQCLFISILMYLQIYQNSTLTLRDLRDIAGLDTSTEEIMFDINTPKYKNAIEKIANTFDLKITFIPVDHDGNILHGGNLIDVIGNGVNEFRIAQFGTYHFQLVDDNQLDIHDFVPYIPYQDELIPMDSITSGSIKPGTTEYNRIQSDIIKYEQLKQVKIIKQEILNEARSEIVASIETAMGKFDPDQIMKIYLEELYIIDEEIQFLNLDKTIIDLDNDIKSLKFIIKMI
jgi:hypothetical protein